MENDILDITNRIKTKYSDTQRPEREPYEPPIKNNIAEKTVGTLQGMTAKVAQLNQAVSDYVEQSKGEVYEDVSIADQEERNVRLPFSISDPLTWIGLKTEKQMVDFERVERRKVETPYDYGDLTEIIHESLGSVRVLNDKLGEYIENIDQTVADLTDKRIQYQDQYIESGIKYMESKDSVAEVKDAIGKLEKTLDGFEKFDRERKPYDANLIHMENILSERKSDTIIYGNRTAIKENYGEVIGIFQKVLKNAKEEGRSWHDKIDNVVGAIEDVTVTAENINGICTIIGDASYHVADTIEKVQFLTTDIGNAHQLMQDGSKLGGYNGEPSIDVTHLKDAINTRMENEKDIYKELDNRVLGGNYEQVKRIDPAV